MAGSKLLNVLIIEDIDSKFEDIKNKIDSVSNDSDITFEVVRKRSSISAIKAAEETFFEVVILDLEIPKNDHGDNGTSEIETSIEYGRDVYQQLVSNNRNRPLLIFGVTKHEKSTFEEYFPEDDPVLSIVQYDKDGYWADIFKYRLQFHLDATSAYQNHLYNTYSIDVLILVARKYNEFDPIVKHMNWLGQTETAMERWNSFYHQFGEIKLKNIETPLRVGIICIGEVGLSSSAAITSSAISEFRPRVLAMLGMCCGFGKGLPLNSAARMFSKFLDPFKPKSDMRDMAKLGDVIVVKETSNWDEGRYQDDRTGLIERVEHLTESSTANCGKQFKTITTKLWEGERKHWETLLDKHYRTLDIPETEKSIKMKFDPKGKVHFGHLLSGSSVIDSQKKIQEIRRRFPSAIGLEMEAHSIYTTAEKTFGAVPETIVIKGVADYGDGNKAKIIQPVASVASYIIFEEILPHIFSSSS